MADFWTTVGDYWLQFVFGDPLIAALVVMLTVGMISLRMGIQTDGLIVLAFVSMFVLGGWLMPEWITVLMLIIGGLIFGLALARIMGSR